MLSKEKYELIVEYVFDDKDRDRISKEMNKSLGIILLGRVLPLFVLIFIYGLIALVHFKIGFTLFDYIFYPIMFVFTILLVFLLPKILTKVFKKFEVGSKDCRVEFGSEGIRADLTKEKLNLKWEYITRVKEREEYIYFRMSMIQIFTLPKRALNLSQLEELYSILQKYVDKKKLKLLEEQR